MNARDVAKKLNGVLRRTPLHPQWLLGSDSAIAGWVSTNAVGRVLDVGCADRWLQSRLSQQCEYIGLDYPPTGREMYGAKPDVFGNASCLPIADECVDTVVLLEVLEHIRCPREALSEAARVLRPGGRMLLSVPFIYPIHDAPHDYQRLTSFGLVRDAEEAGFSVDAISGRLGSVEAAGLLACLSLIGTAMEAIRRRRPGVVLVPVLVLLVPVVNLAAWCGKLLLPSWEALTNGYLLAAHKS